MIQRNKALNLLGDTEIHKAAQDQASVLNNKGRIMDSPRVLGIKNTSSVIPIYATLNPPKIEQNTLKRPIFLPFCSTVFKLLYILIIDNIFTFIILIIIISYM